MTLADRVIKRINDDRIARGMLTLSGEKRTLVCAALDAATAENLSAASPTPTARTAREEPEYVARTRRGAQSNTGLCHPAEVRDLLDYVNALTADNAALRAEVERIDAACLEVCPCNDPKTVGEDAYSDDFGRYVVQDEDGEPIIDTSDPCDVIRAWSGLCGAAQEELERTQRDLTTARAALERVREVQSVGGMMLTDDVLSAVDGAR